MVYVDTNVLIYAAIEQDFAKKERSIALLEFDHSAIHAD